MKIEGIKDQINLANSKTLKLLSNISSEKWFETPTVLNSNINWQIGHIILANYLHGIASLTGANVAFKKKVDVQNYLKYYGPNSSPSQFLNEKPNHEELLEVYKLTISLILDGVSNLKLNELDKDTAIPNPAVKTKYEALLWLSQHQNWHNGQIAMLNRILN